MSHPRSAERKRVTDGERRAHEELSIVPPVCIFTESPDLPAQPFSGGELSEANQSSVLASVACERPLAPRWTWNKADVGRPQDNRRSLKERRWWGGGEAVKEDNTALGHPASPELLINIYREKNQYPGGDSFPRDANCCTRQSTVAAGGRWTKQPSSD